MRNVRQFLQNVEQLISTPDERGYFLTHSVRYEHVLNEIEKIARGKNLTILDIGCFPYHMGKALELMGHTMYGIASRHEPVKQKNIKTLNIETDTFPFKDNFFDLILCSEVVEHLPHSPVLTIQESYRITKKNGYLLITTPNIARSINRAKLLAGTSVMYPTEVYFENGGKGNLIYHRHNREYTMSELCRILGKTHWSIDKKEYFISYTPFRKRIVPDPLWLKLIKVGNYLSMLPLPSFQDTLCVVAKK